MRDPYQILGVSKSSTADEIKSAYRKLAKKLHPDVNPGRKDIEQKFKEITAAYDLLSDKDKRARFDRGEVDAQGNERAYSSADSNPYGAGNWRNPRGGPAGGDPFGQFSNADDIFAEFMGSMRGNKRTASATSVRGPDVTYSLAIPFVDAALGGKRRLTLSSGKTIDVSVPPGTDEGNKLRLRGLGMAGTGGGPGDAIIELHVEPHAYFVRKDFDIQLDVPISLPEAVLGATVKVPTLETGVSVKVPKGANSDTVLRLKGKGIPKPDGTRGDMFVKLKIMLPDPPSSDELTQFAEKWVTENPYDPRRKLGW